VLFDWVYILAYLAIFGALLEAVVSLRLRATGKVVLSRRLDLWSCLVITVGYLGGIALVAFA
jgi:hypothetical protein